MRPFWAVVMNPIGQLPLIEVAELLPDGGNHCKVCAAQFGCARNVCAGSQDVVVLTVSLDPRLKDWAVGGCFLGASSVPESTGSWSIKTSLSPVIVMPYWANAVRSARNSSLMSLSRFNR